MYPQAQTGDEVHWIHCAATEQGSRARLRANQAEADCALRDRDLVDGGRDAAQAEKKGLLLWRGPVGTGGLRKIAGRALLAAGRSAGRSREPAGVPLERDDFG